MGHSLPEFSDKANCGGVAKTLTVAAGATAELKVGASVLTEREYVTFEALDTGVKWGFLDGAGNQPTDAFKSQFFMLPLGDGTSIWFLNTGGSPANIAIGEIA